MIGWPSSLRSRLTLWYTMLLGIPLIVFAVGCYLVVQRTLERRTDVFIGDALNAFSRELTAERRASWRVVDAMRSTVDEVRFRELHIAILDSTGTVVAMNALPDDDVAAGAQRRPSLDIETTLLAALRRQDLTRDVSLTIPSTLGAFRVLSRPFTSDSARFSLTGAYSLHDIDDVLDRIRELFLIAIPLLLVSAAFGGYALARRSLAPVAAMAAQASEISASNMHARLPVGGGDELVGLARVVNGLLERLERSFDRQRQFITDASHELRTPTAVVRTETDITLSREHRPEPEYRASIAVIQNAAGRLTRLVDEMFLLSRADSGHLTTRFQPLYLEELVHDATRAVQSVAHGHNVDVQLHDVVEAPFVGDADLLGRVLLNLLDNAIKYSPRGATVHVAMARRANNFLISVIDSGAGIPFADRDRVFERFFRLDSARSRAENSSTSGAGLGLAIARRIAELHGGAVEIAESRPGRTEFVLRLPSSGSRADTSTAS